MFLKRQFAQALFKFYRKTLGLIIKSHLHIQSYTNQYHGLPYLEINGKLLLLYSSSKLHFYFLFITFKTREVQIIKCGLLFYVLYRQKKRHWRTQICNRNPMRTDNHDSGKPVVTLYWLEVMGVYWGDCLFLTLFWLDFIKTLSTQCCRE